MKNDVNRRKKVVIRKYTSKKTGKTKTYRYEYFQFKVRNGRKTKTVTRSAKNIIYRGKVTKYGREWIEEYKKGLDISDRNELEAQIISAERHKRTVKSSSMISRMKETKIERYLYNMGGDIYDLSEDMNISEEDLMRESNWTFKGEEGYFTFNGITYEFHFKYKEHTIDWSVVNEIIQ